MGFWRDVGQLSNSFMLEFEQHVSEARANGVRASLGIVISESARGLWGDTRKDLPAKVMEQLSGMINTQSYISITPKGPQRIQRDLLSPEILDALEKNKIRFLVGTAPDGCRHVALVILE